MSSGHQKKYLKLALAVVVSFCCSGNPVSAQGDFGSFQIPQGQSPRSDSAFVQQESPQANVPRAHRAQAQAPQLIESRSAPSPVLPRPESTWPDQPVQYDDFVKQANLEQSDRAQGVNRLIDSTVDSAGQMLGSWKNQIKAKTEHLFGSDGPESADGGWLGSISQRASSPDVRRMLGSLALVVGGYLLLVVVLRKLGGGVKQGIPAEVVSVLGNLPYGHKQNLRLVRLGSKLVLLLNGPEGTHPIGEITDSNEVDYLVSLCQGKRAVRPPATLSASNQPGSQTRAITEESLAQVLRRLEQATRGGTANYEA